MEEKYMYSILELTYAKQNGLSTDETYERKVKKILPRDWLSYTTETRIHILDEAISSNIKVTETKLYTSLTSKEGYIQKR